MNISNQFADINTIKPNNFKNLDTKNLSKKSDDKLKDVCNDFEAYFINQMLQVSLKQSKLAGEGAGSDIIKSMYTDALSQESAGNIGISDMLYQFLSKENR